MCFGLFQKQTNKTELLMFVAFKSSPVLHRYKTCEKRSAEVTLSSVSTPSMPVLGIVLLVRTQHAWLCLWGSLLGVIFKSWDVSAALKHSPASWYSLSRQTSFPSVLVGSNSVSSSLLQESLLCTVCNNCKLCVRTGSISGRKRDARPPILPRWEA